MAGSHEINHTEKVPYVSKCDADTSAISGISMKARCQDFLEQLGSGYAVSVGSFNKVDPYCCEHPGCDRSFSNRSSLLSVHDFTP
jgi:hypothetical protein